MSVLIQTLEDNIESLRGIKEELINRYRHSALCDEIAIVWEIDKLQNYIDKAEARLLKVRQDYHD